MHKCNVSACLRVMLVAREAMVPLAKMARVV